MKIRTLGLVVVVSIAVAACGSADATPSGFASSSGGVASLDTGGGSGSSDSGAESTGEVDTEAQLLAFAECVRAQGFDIPDPTVDADGNVRLQRSERTEGLQEARQACEEFLEGVTLGFRGGDQTARQDQLLEFAACMRDNGVDFPDPDFSSGGGGRGLAEDIDRDSPAYQSAFAQCRDLFGGARGGN